MVEVMDMELRQDPQHQDTEQGEIILLDDDPVMDVYNLSIL